MNIPIMKDNTTSLFNLKYFNHDQEMENVSKHIYLEYKGGRTGVIGGNDPFEESIIGISPKVFTMLMLARANLCFRPAASHPLVGIMLEVPLSFGTFTVYSSKPNYWVQPTAATQHLGFTMMFNRHLQSLAYAVQEYDFQVIAEPSTEFLVVGSTFRFQEETYLADVFDEVYGLLLSLQQLDKQLKGVSPATIM